MTEQRFLEQRLLMNVAKKLSPNDISFLGIELGLEHYRIKQIKHDNRESAMQALEVLNIARQMYPGRNFISDVLIPALNTCSLGDISSELRNPNSTDVAATTGVAVEAAVISREKGLLHYLNILKPAQKEDSRSNAKRYIVGVDIYSDEIPRSQLGVNELPYLYALLSDHPMVKVTAWKDCPPKETLNKSFQVLKKEIQLVERILSYLDNCGLHLKSSLSLGFERVFKVIYKLWDPFPVKLVDNIMCLFPEELVCENLKLKTLSGTDQIFLKMIIHLYLFFGTNVQFVFRKDFHPKPSAYLLFGKFVPHISPIVLEKDKKIVGEALGYDENCYQTVADDTAGDCPF